MAPVVDISRLNGRFAPQSRSYAASVDNPKSRHSFVPLCEFRMHAPKPEDTSSGDTSADQKASNVLHARCASARHVGLMEIRGCYPK